jgi:hypothetical protein
MGIVTTGRSDQKIRHCHPVGELYLRSGVLQGITGHWLAKCPNILPTYPGK